MDSIRKSDIVVDCMRPESSFNDQIESNRKKLVELCAAIEREVVTVAAHHSSTTKGESRQEKSGSSIFRKARVLLIDDSKFARGVVKGFLESVGHSVEEASSGGEGLELFALSRHDLVITDIVMEGLGGLEVLDRILEINPAARVIIASSNLQLLTRKAALERGAVGLVIKPINGERLNQIVAGIMAINSELRL